MNVKSPLLLLRREVVAPRINMQACIDAVESAFALHARGCSLKPSLLHVDAVGGEFHVKAGGLLGDRPVFACKINGAFKNNRALGLPTIVGLILLSDAATGTPLAIMESGLVTQMRTGAATAVAARLLARKESETALICGAGAQGEIQLEALLQVLPLRRVFAWSRSGAAAFATRMAKRFEVAVETVSDPGVAARQSDVIVTCTPATKWFLARAHVKPGTFISAVGADSPTKQELEPALVASSAVVCDLTSQCAAVGELHHALDAKLMTLADTRGELGQVLIGAVPSRLNDEEIIVFDSTGTALQDAAAAAVVAFA